MRRQRAIVAGKRPIAPARRIVSSRRPTGERRLRRPLPRHASRGRAATKLNQDARFLLDVDFDGIVDLADACSWPGGVPGGRRIRDGA